MGLQQIQDALSARSRWDNLVLMISQAADSVTSKISVDDGANAPHQVLERPLVRADDVYRSLDAWRGVAALGVVAFHAGGIVQDQTPSVAGNALFAFARYAYLGVEMFFVISGYCIAAALVGTITRNRSLRDFVVARVRRIFPTYWASCVLFLALGFALAFLKARGTIPGSVLGDTIAANNNLPFYLANMGLLQLAVRQPLLSQVAWTLCYEASFYLICAGAIALCRRRGAGFALGSLHALTVAMCVILIAAPRLLAYPLDMWPLFGLGVLVYDVRRAQTSVVGTGPRLPLAAFGTATVLLLAFAALRSVPYGYLMRPSRWSVLTGVVFALALWAMYAYDAALMKNRVVRAFAKVGLFSYSLYLIQFTCIGLVNQALGLAKLNDANPFARFALMCAVAVAGGYVFYLLFERPLIRLAQRKKPVANSASAMPPSAPVAPAPNAAG